MQFFLCRGKTDKGAETKKKLLYYTLTKIHYIGLDGGCIVLSNVFRSWVVYVYNENIFYLLFALLNIGTFATQPGRNGFDVICNSSIYDLIQVSSSFKRWQALPI